MKIGPYRPIKPPRNALILVFSWGGDSPVTQKICVIFTVIFPLTAGGGVSGR